MNKLFCAVVLTVLAAGSARAADNAFGGLMLLAAPAALENAVPTPPLPTPATEPAATATPLTAETIKGQYALRPRGFGPLEMTLADDLTIIRRDPAGDVVCKGVYELRPGPILAASLTNCGSKFSLQIDLAGQTVETLSAGVSVLGSGNLAEDSIPKLPLTIKKIN
jgi:hypothetical protein